MPRGGCLSTAMARKCGSWCVMTDGVRRRERAGVGARAGTSVTTMQSGQGASRRRRAPSSAPGAPSGRSRRAGARAHAAGASSRSAAAYGSASAVDPCGARPAASHVHPQGRSAPPRLQLLHLCVWRTKGAQHAVSVTSGPLPTAAAQRSVRCADNQVSARMPRLVFSCPL